MGIIKELVPQFTRSFNDERAEDDMGLASALIALGMPIGEPLI